MATDSGNGTLEKNIRVNNLSGVAQSLAANMFAPFLGIFAIKLGASNTIIALLSSLPALMCTVSAIPGALYIRRHANMKRLTASLTFASRAFYLLTALVPWVDRDHRAVALVALIGLMNLPGAIATLCWQSYIAGLIPRERRGDAFAKRNRLMTLAGFGPTLLVGYLLDFFSFPFGYQLIFGCAFAVALIEIYYLLRLESQAVDGEESPQIISRPIIQVVGEAIREGPFRRFMGRSLFFYFTWQMGWPLFTIYQVKYLGANNAWTGIFAVSSSLTSFLTYQWWGRYGDRLGNVKGLALATLGMALTPMFYAFSSHLFMITVLNLSVGFFTAGTSLFLFNGLLEVSPDNERTEYIAIGSTLINLSATVAPIVGKWMVDISGIKGALFITSALRILGFLGFYKLAYAKAADGAEKKPAADLRQSAQ